MSFALYGLAVSSGIAIGRAHLVSHATLEVAHYKVRDKAIPAEVERFETAVATVRTELDALRGEASQPGTPSEVAAFVDIHAMILDDPLLSELPKDLIRERRCNAEWALVQQMELLVEQFEEIEDSYLRERKHDVVQVVERVLKALMGKAQQAGQARQGRRPDHRRPRPLAGRHHPVQDPEDRWFRHRPGRRHLAYRHRRAQPGDSGGGRPAPCPAAGARGRPGHRRRQPRRADRRTRTRGYWRNTGYARANWSWNAPSSSA